MGTEFNQVSQDAQRALEEFSEEFAMALVQPGVDTWAKDLGIYKASRALKTTYPIPVSAAGYKPLKGDIKYRALLEKSIELKPDTWTDGVEELASVIEAPDFIGWTGQPAAMAAAATALLNVIIAGLLEANAVHPLDNKTFFASDHPVNIFDVSAGTFDNDISGDATVAGLTAAKSHFRGIKAPNGLPLGLRMTHLMVPAAKEEKGKDLLEQDTLIQTVGSSFGSVGNRHKGTVQLIVADELSNDDQIYGLALNKPGMFPWICQDEGTPEQLILDKTSDYYKRTLKVAIANVLRGNGGLALPHCVVRLDGSD